MTKFSGYLETIARVNHLVPDIKSRENCAVKNKGAVEWLFHEGMLFASPQKWWDDFKIRATPHEGIDITYYRGHHFSDLSSPDTDRPVMSFDPTIQVPALAGGTIVNICNDFLARTIVVQYKKNKPNNTRVLLAYAHIQPGEKISKGQSIQKNEIIAIIGPTHKNPKLPCHLHISCIEVSDSVPVNTLNWNLFTQTDQVCLINPFFL